jgi:hypothetical protein
MEYTLRMYSGQRVTIVPITYSLQSEMVLNILKVKELKSI